VSFHDDSRQPRDGASDDEEDGQQESASGDEHESGTDEEAASASVGLPGVYDDDDHEFECVIGGWSKKVMMAAVPGAAVGGGALSLGRSDIDDLDDVVRSYELKQRQLIQELLPQQLDASDASATASARAPDSGSEGGSMTM
jgi:hypothetical protein